MRADWTYRPTLRGRRLMVASGHYLASMAGIRMLERDGTAVDAGVAMGLAINVVQPGSCDLGGVAPTLVYDRQRDAVWQISGLGHYPARATIDWYRTVHGGRIPPGVPATVTPAALGSWVTALQRFGTKSFAEIVQPALELAGRGFPADDLLAEGAAKLAANPIAADVTLAIFAPGRKPPQTGDLVVQSDLARSFERLIEAERAARGDREQGLQAVLDEFYRGTMAHEMAAHNQACGGVLTVDDIAAHRTRVEPALMTTYRGHRVYACGPWCQGPVTLQALNMLEKYDVAARGRLPGEHLHFVGQVLNAAMADRHTYYGDPEMVRVPLNGLLSKAYANTWTDRISHKAFGEMPTPGDAWEFDDTTRIRPDLPASAQTASVPPDTTYLCAVDGAGNAMSATPSDGVFGNHSSIVPGLGFKPSDRGDQGWLDPEHPAAVHPGKRPRLTPNPGFAVWSDGRIMPFGTPGGDVQAQAMTQVLVNLIDFGMSPQAAIEAPRIWSESFPGSWDPHPYKPGVLVVEERIAADVRAELTARGHTVTVTEPWTWFAGAVCIVRANPERGLYEGGADPRRMSYAIGW